MLSQKFTLYRYLTGPDDETFCRRITELLGRGWVLYGSPTLAHDGKRVICGQAITKEIDRSAYDPAKELSSY